MQKNSDITAVILSMGEATLPKCVDSVKKQTLAPDEIIYVKNVSPFYKAWNTGMQKVKTRYFVQVDADMLLDENCFEKLHACMTPTTGLAIGHLRDPLLGRIRGIKMFRHDCCQMVPFPNTISPDTDFYNAMGDHGWNMVLALNFFSNNPLYWHTLGDHRPHYHLEYIIAKFLRLGCRYRYRVSPGGLKHMFRLLENSYHPMSPIAQFALANGLFMKGDRDLLTPDFSVGLQQHVLAPLLQTSNSFTSTPKLPEIRLKNDPRETFLKYYQMGIDFRKSQDSIQPILYLQSLSNYKHRHKWVAKAGLGAGYTTGCYNEKEFENKFHMLTKLLN